MLCKEKLEGLRVFHGHLGPCVIVGMRLGEYALDCLHAYPHFGLEAVIRCAAKPPESCLLDGIQVSTGCTLGKQNITHIVGGPIEVCVRNQNTDQEITLGVHADKLPEALRLLREESEAAAVAYVCNLPTDQLIMVHGKG